MNWICHFFVLSDEDSPFSSPSKEVSATDRHTDPYDQPLYPGAASDLTVFYGLPVDFPVLSET